MANPTEHTAEVFIAWDETGAYAVATKEVEAIETLQDQSEGVKIRTKRYQVPLFLPECEDGGELHPAI